MKDRKKIAEVIFFIGFFIDIFIMAFSMTVFKFPFEPQLIRICFLLFGLKTLITIKDYTWKEWLIIISVGIVGSIYYFHAHSIVAICAIMMLVASKNIEPTKIFKIVFWLSIIAIVSVTLLSFTDKIGPVYIEKYWRSDVLERRYAFGFGHPNAYHSIVLMIYLFALYLYNDKTKWYHYIILGVINLAINYFTDSRTSFVLCMLTIVLASLFRYRKSFQNLKIVYILGSLVVIFSTLFSLIVAVCGPEGAFLEKLNNSLTGRLGLAYESAGIEVWTLFSSVEGIKAGVIDMGFIRLFCQYGYIIGILYIIANLLLIRWAYKYKNYKVLIIVVIFSIYSVVELYGVTEYMSRNIILLLLLGTWQSVFGLEKIDDFSDSTNLQC